MHDSVRSSGTCSSRPRAITADFSHATNGASIAIPCARPSDSARPIAAKNSGVASGNGLPASGPIAMRPMPRYAHAIAALVSSTMLRPTM